MEWNWTGEKKHSIAVNRMTQNIGAIRFGAAIVNKRGRLSSKYPTLSVLSEQFLYPVNGYGEPDPLCT